MSKQILASWKVRDFPSFKEALLDKDVQLNYQYPEEGYRSLLESIADTIHAESGLFANALIEKGASPDLVNQLTGRAALHAAVEALNIPVLEVLLSSNADVNVQTNDGSTALHLLARKVTEKEEKTQEKCLELILARPDVYLDHVNNEGKTAVVKAYEQKAWGVLMKLIKAGAGADDLDYSLDGSPSMRDEIMKRFPEVLEALPQVLVVKNPLIKSSNYQQLLALLDNSNEDKFCYEFNMYMADLRNRATSYYEIGQLLERAIVLSCHKAATTLVEFVVSNEGGKSTAKFQKEVFTACLVGNHKILELLLKYDEKAATSTDGRGRTVFHILAAVSPFTENYLKCWNLVKPPLEKASFLSTGDENEKTALHLAAQSGNTQFINLLLLSGANLFAADKSGLGAWENINDEIIDRFLNEKIERKMDKGEFYFDLQFINHNHQSNQSFDDLDPLMFKNNKQKQPEMINFKSLFNPDESVTEKAAMILTHPIFQAFFKFKWRLARPFYIFELFYQSLFTLFLFLYMYVTWPPYAFFVFLRIVVSMMSFGQLVLCGLHISAYTSDLLINPNLILKSLTALSTLFVLYLEYVSMDSYVSICCFVFLSLTWIHLIGQHPNFSLVYHIIRTIVWQYFLLFIKFFLITVIFYHFFGYRISIFNFNWTFPETFLGISCPVVFFFSLLNLKGLGNTFSNETQKSKIYSIQKVQAVFLYNFEVNYVLLPRFCLRKIGNYLKLRAFSYLITKFADRLFCFSQNRAGLVCLTNKDNLILRSYKPKKVPWWDINVYLDRFAVLKAQQGLDSLKPPPPEPELPIKDLERRMFRLTEMMSQIKTSIDALTHSEKEMESLLIQSLRIHSLRDDENV